MPGAFSRHADKLQVEGMPSYDTFIIMHDDLDVGFVGTIKLNQDTIYLLDFYLESKHQGKGIGYEAMSILVDKYSEEGLKSIVLLVHHKAEWAKVFYERFGFTCVSHKKEEIISYRSGFMKDLYINGTELYLYTLG